ncbi:MAG: NAD-binding protein, partial [Lachnospiraceae bacterium]|nr:NAD-binding protein [Lachnospiraceae bacterium]
MFGNKNTQKGGMSIIIVGCGKVGSALVERLSGEGHNITIIDKDEAKIQAVTNMYDVMGVNGNGASYSVQVDAGIDTADLFIAVTDSDELNLL